MKVLIINAVCGSGSTGRIVTDLCKDLKTQGHEVKVIYGVGQATNIDEEDTICMNNKAGYYIHNALAKMTDHTGLYSTPQTWWVTRKIREFAPDVIHLHNLHGYYINYKVLFEFLADYDHPVIWTLHDCWAFTGHCAYFSALKCNKWKTQCYDCPGLSEYPICKFKGDVEKNFRIKKNAFTSVRDMRIVTPSKWLANLASQSYLGTYPITVINNRVDRDIFKPRQSNFRNDHGLIGKKVILGVSNVWNSKKGFSDFLKLSTMLGDAYAIVMVGLTESQLGDLPSNIVGIQRTQSTQELAEIYSASDVFVNLTYQDNYPTVNLEALACGTPIVTYNTDGSIEAADETCGVIVEQGDIEGVIKAIDSVLKLNRENAVLRSKTYMKNNEYDTYMALYDTVLK